MPENRQFVYIEDPNVCYWCDYKVEDHEEVCFKCGFPQRADEWTQRGWLGAARKKKKDYNINLKWARILLFCMAGYYAFSGIVSYAWTQDMVELIFFIVIILMYTGLGIWAYKKSPYVPLIIGLCIYAILVTLAGISAPETLWQGLLVKIIIVVAFIRSIRFAATMSAVSSPKEDEDVLHD